MKGTWETPLLDICETRHRGNSESVAANDRVDKNAGRLAVINILARQKATAKEIANILGVGINVISGRCSELKAQNKVRPTGIRREGSMELQICPGID